MYEAIKVWFRHLYYWTIRGPNGYGRLVRNWTDALIREGDYKEKYEWEAKRVELRDEWLADSRARESSVHEELLALQAQHEQVLSDFAELLEELEHFAETYHPATLPGNTCPLIDTVLYQMDQARENCRGMDSTDDPDDIDNAFGAIDQNLDWIDMEPIREANATLREEAEKVESMHDDLTSVITKYEEYKG